MKKIIALTVLAAFFSTLASRAQPSSGPFPVPVAGAATNVSGGTFSNVTFTGGSTIPYAATSATANAISPGATIPGNFSGSAPYLFVGGALNLVNTNIITMIGSGAGLEDLTYTNAFNGSYFTTGSGGQNLTNFAGMWFCDQGSGVYKGVCSNAVGNYVEYQNSNFSNNAFAFYAPTNPPYAATAGGLSSPLSAVTNQYVVVPYTFNLSSVWLIGNPCYQGNYVYSNSVGSGNSTYAILTNASNPNLWLDYTNGTIPPGRIVYLWTNNAGTSSLLSTNPCWNLKLYNALSNQIVNGVYLTNNVQGTVFYFNGVVGTPPTYFYLATNSMTTNFFHATYFVTGASPSDGTLVTNVSAARSYGKPIELLGGQYYQPFWSDNLGTNGVPIGIGTNLPFSDGTTNWTVIGTGSSGNFALVTNREVMLTNLTANSYCSLVGPILPVLGTNAANWAFKAHLTLGNQAFNNLGQIILGFTTTASTPAAAQVYPLGGLVMNSYASGGLNGGPATNGFGMVSNSTVIASIYNLALKDFDAVDAVVVLTTNGFICQLQGSVADQYDDYIGSASWNQILVETNIPWGTNALLPIFCYSSPSVGGSCAFGSRFEIYSNWSVQGGSGVLLQQQFQYTSSLPNPWGLACYMCPDAFGGWYAAWQFGYGNATTNDSIFACYRNSSNVWQFPITMVVAASPPSGGVTNILNAGSIWTNLTGKIIVDYNKTTNGALTYMIYWRTNYWNGTNLVVGPENIYNITNMPDPNNQYVLSYAPAIITADGMLTKPIEYETTNASDFWFTNAVIKSSDNGITWMITTGGPWDTNLRWIEGACYIQPDGKLVQLLRAADASGSPWIGISYSTDSGLTWSTPVQTTMPSNDRTCVQPLPNGLLLVTTSSDVFNSVNGLPVSYIVGNNGVVLQKIILSKYRGANDYYNYIWAGWVDNKIGYMLTPKLESSVWFFEKSLDGQDANRLPEQRRLSQQINSLMHP